jgi:hypothetical protein
MPPDKNNNKSDHLIKLAVSYLRSQLQPALWTEGTKHCSQASHLVRPIQVSCLQQMAHNTKEIKKKRKEIQQSQPKLSYKKGSTLPHKAQNTKRQYQDWTPKE